MMGEDIGTAPESVALQAAIEAIPEDEAPQLVLADYLQAAGDLRGELIVLDLRERAGDLNDRDGLERLLLLAAEYSFPRARPEDPPLAWWSYSSQPPNMTALHNGKHYQVRYRRRVLEVLVDELRSVLTTRLELAKPDEWTTDERIVILRLLGDAIRAGTPLQPLLFPFMEDPLPIYEGGPLRGYRLPREFTKPRGIAAHRYGLAPRDFHRWIRIWARLAKLQ